MIVKRIVNAPDGASLVIVRNDELLSVENDVRKAHALYTHVKKRLSDEFTIELTSDWENRVLKGEHDVPLPDTADLEYVKMSRALRNVSQVARRMANRSNKGGINVALLSEDLGHIMRFCEEVGVTSSVLRMDRLTMSQGMDSLGDKG